MISRSGSPSRGAKAVESAAEPAGTGMGGVVCGLGGRLDPESSIGPARGATGDTSPPGGGDDSGGGVVKSIHPVSTAKDRAKARKRLRSMVLPFWNWIVTAPTPWVAAYKSANCEPATLERA